MNFFESSVRVPFIVYAPHRFKSRRVAKNISLVDLLPTLLALAAGRQKPPEPIVPIDGHSLSSLLTGDESSWPDLVLGEYLAEGTTAPCFMVKRGAYKYIHCRTDAPQLFDLGDDPKELNNLAGQSSYAAIERALAETVGRWDAEEIATNVVQSQRQRLFTFRSLMQGQVTPWDFQPHRDASKQYTRNHETMDDADRRARIPYREVPTPDVSAD
jgi:choline-sulfatase